MAKKADTALLIIDMLNDFVLEGAPLEVPDTRKIVNNIQQELKKAREQAMWDMGLVKVRGAMGGVYWE